MKRLFFSGWMTAVFLFAAVFQASAADMVNTACPVMPEHQAKADRTVEYKGKTYGFCCKSCIKKFKADPEKFIAGMQTTKTCSGDVCT